MMMRTKIAKTCLLSALLSTTAMVPTGALAQNVIGGSAVGANAFTDGLDTSAAWPANAAPPPASGAMVVKAAPVPPVPYWWYHGEVEVGGRGFINDPKDHGEKAVNNGKSLAGYYQYNDIAPGVFGNFDIATGTSDGLYQIEAAGSNVGYEDQRYYFDYSKAGEQYFNFMWDQSPHVYSRSAMTPFLLNGNTLTLVPGAAGLPVPTTTAALTAAGIAGVYGPFALPVNIGIDRDTAAADYRWTPTEAWDLYAEYLHMYRHGTQVSGEAEGVATNNIQVTKPVDDVTQNYDAKGQYVGTSPWGQRLVVEAGYEGSDFHDTYNDFLVQAVSGKIAGAGAVGTPSTAFAAISTWPSNRSDAFTSSASADLPWNSRYTGTLNYSVMQQNSAFAPAADYANLFTGALNGTPATFLNGNPGNLGGEIDTLLSNNVVTTKIDPTLTAKTSFRYYDFDNRTPSYNLTAMPNGFAPTNTLVMGYDKINAGEALDWRPDKYWNIGAAYSFERYDWTDADADVTNQNGVKVFADYKPFPWLTSRASAEFNDRRYNNYNYLQYVGNFQWPVATCAPNSNCGPEYSSAYRQLMYDNREVWNAHYALDFVVFPGVTFSPWLKYQDMTYGVDPANQFGLEDSKQWNAGIDATWVVDPKLSLTAGYSWADLRQTAYGPCINGGDPLPAVCNIAAHGVTQNLPEYTIQTSDRQTQNFVTAGIKYAPTDLLDFDLRYSGSLADDNMQALPPTPATAGATIPAGLPIYAANGQFPENKVWYQRLDATGIYKFSPDQLAAVGWKGQLKVKVTYTWESNSETNWANDFLTPYIGASVGSAVGYGVQQDLWLAWYNPNYNVQMITGSLIASW
jgi:MtrB/PioB family decaheme-associated outer membrane protein